MVKIITPESGNSLNGVLSFFTQKGDINSYVEVFSTPAWSGHPKEDILSQSSEEFFASADRGDNLYIGLQLKKHILELKYFTIVQYTGEDYFLSNWKLQGSNSSEDSNWKDLYSEVANTEYCKSGPIPTYSIKPENWGIFTSFRILKTGTDCRDDNYLRVAHIELFGALTGPFTNDEISHYQFTIKYSFVYIILFTLNK